MNVTDFNALSDKEKIAKTTFVVEATDFEQLVLWDKWHDKLDWQEISRGLLRTIGELDDRPICVSLLWSLLNGKPVCFYEATSQVVDYELVNEWRNKTFHAAGHCNAMNFHLCLHVVEER